MWSEVEWGEVKCSIGKGGGRVFNEKVYRDSKWWEVNDGSESVSELMIWGGGEEEQLQETVRSSPLLGCFYLLYMLYSNLSRVYCC